MIATIDTAPAVQFKSRSVNIPVLNIYTSNLDSIKHSIQQQISSSSLFNHASIILDLSYLDDTVDTKALIALCNNFTLHPIATQGGNKLLNESFQAHGIRQLSNSSAVESSQPEYIVTKTVRSGQEIYSEKPIVIIGDVSPAAEIMSDASIHIYGELRGKAMAGVRGDTKAHIFAQKSQAELIAIGKKYIVSEQNKMLNFSSPSRYTIMDNKIKVFSL